jgi:glycerol-3-phosphate dehydrogenase
LGSASILAGPNAFFAQNQTDNVRINAKNGSMRKLTTEVLVIGGGATGAGVLRDAAMRGFDTLMVDREDLAMGTTGRFHGLLHSGGRYVVKDPAAANECIVENHVLRRIAADCIEDCGGLFVTTPWDDPAYGDLFHEGCIRSGVPVEEISPAEALRREPRLHPGILRAYAVPDAGIDAWKTVWACVRSAREHGGVAAPYHKVTELVVNGDNVTGAVAEDVRTGETVTIEAGFVVNASGAWAAQIASMAGIDGVTVVPGRGIMIAMNHRLVNSVINRCTMPADGDILVPIRTVSVIGTTDEQVADPDDLDIRQEEVEQMLEAGEKMVPGFREGRALRVWAGVRPLFKDTKVTIESSRDVSRAHALLDHYQRDGVKRFITITGGKFTSFRLMAQDVVDSMCAQLGEERPCRTADEPLPDSADGRFYRIGTRLSDRERERHDDQIVCECELVSRRRLEEAIAQRDTTNLDDLRRALRLGMGPCQGGFCIYRAAGILHGVKRLDGPDASRALCDFLKERWKGVHPILYGDQLRQARLDEWIFQGLLDVEHLPV